ncbi:ribosomal biogenesis factor [Agelaius phoeniceus]|uniref:ribosomal biogenesis factor n=1 Tax=Agelaius phoeniceus TaxID=39638 RepID=UPI004054F4A3
MLVATRSFGLSAWPAGTRQGALSLPVLQKLAAKARERQAGPGPRLTPGPDRDRDKDRDSTTAALPLPGAAPQRPPEAAHAPWRPRAALWAIGVTTPCDVTRPRAAAAAMGKNRGGAAKAGSVFRIARSGVLKAKAKGKARPVTSGLKQINIKNAEKVSTINKAFAEVQKEIRQLSKGTTAEPQNTQKVSTNLEEEPANVDAATSLLSQL